MPISYEIDAGQNLIRTTATGQLTLQEVVNHFRALAKDPQARKPLDVFLDLSAVNSAPDTNQLSVVIGEMKKSRTGLRFGACAILVTQDALFGMMRMFEAYAGEFFRETRTFRVASEAELWLDARRSHPGKSFTA